MDKSSSFQDDKCEVQDLSTDRNFFTILPNIIFHLKLDPWTFKAYCVIKMTAGDAGACFKSNSTMAEEVGCSIPTLIKLKTKLVEKGLIVIKKRVHPTGGNMPDLIQIVEIWGQNAEYMLKKSKKCSDGGSKPGLDKQEHKEQKQKEQQQKASPSDAAAASFYKELKDTNIPESDKIEISKTYSIENVKHALLWISKNEKPLNKGIAAALKWACKTLPEIPKGKAQEKIPVNPEGYNQSYYREVSKVAHQNGVRLEQVGLRYGTNEYLQTEHDKIYFKDLGFLQQIASFLRKKSIDCINLFDMIKACQLDLSIQMN